jgi:hypothetical protein
MGSIISGVKAPAALVVLLVNDHVLKQARVLPEAPSVNKAAASGISTRKWETHRHGIAARGVSPGAWGDRGCQLGATCRLRLAPWLELDGSATDLEMRC